MPHAELGVEPTGEDQTEGGPQPKREQPKREQPAMEPDIKQPIEEPEVGGEQTAKESETSEGPGVQTEVPGVHIELVPSGVVEATPLQVDDSPLRPKPSASEAPGTEASRWGKGKSYTRRRKMMGWKGTVDFVGSSSEE